MLNCSISTKYLVGDHLVDDLIKSVVELKQLVGILTSTANSLMDQTTPADVTSCKLPSEIKLQAKTFEEIDRLEELLQVPSSLLNKHW